MSYCTLLELLEAFGADLLAQAATPAPWQVDTRLIEDAIRFGTAGYTAEEQACAAATLSRINSKIEAGKADIDGYVGTRMSLPLADVPLLLKKINEQLAYYYLWRTPAAEIRALYDDAIKKLTDISTGKITLASTPQTTPQSVGVPMFYAGGIFPHGWQNEYR